MSEFDSQVPFTEIMQRSSRTLRFRISKDGVPFDLNGSQAIFVMKPRMRTDETFPEDGESVVIKRTVGYPNGPGGGWPVGEINYVLLPPPNGGTPLLWGMDIVLKPADITTDVAPGQYFIQIDIIPVDPTDRFPAVQGNIDIKPTGIKEL